MDFTTLSLHELYSEKNARLQLLQHTDYKALKAYEGHPSDDWTTITAQREQWREDISAIDAQIATLEAAGGTDEGV